MSGLSKGDVPKAWLKGQVPPKPAECQPRVLFLGLSKAQRRWLQIAHVCICSGIGNAGSLNLSWTPSSSHRSPIAHKPCLSIPAGTRKAERSAS